jgi:hypothetical protein
VIVEDDRGVEVRPRMCDMAREKGRIEVLSLGDESNYRMCELFDFSARWKTIFDVRTRSMKKSVAVTGVCIDCRQ